MSKILPISSVLALTNHVYKFFRYSSSSSSSFQNLFFKAFNPAVCTVKTFFHDCALFGCNTKRSTFFSIQNICFFPPPPSIFSCLLFSPFRTIEMLIMLATTTIKIQKLYKRERRKHNTLAMIVMSVSNHSF